MAKVKCKTCGRIVEEEDTILQTHQKLGSIRTCKKHLNTGTDATKKGDDK